MFTGFLETDSFGLFFSCQNFVINTEYLRWALQEMYGEMRAGGLEKEGKIAVKYTASHCQACNSNGTLLEEAAESCNSLTQQLIFSGEVAEEECVRFVCCSHPLLTGASCAFSKVTLQRSSGLDETGRIVWYLALCLLLAWIIVAAALYKGIKSSGKVC